MAAADRAMGEEGLGLCWGRDDDDGGRLGVEGRVVGR